MRFEPVTEPPNVFAIRKKAPPRGGAVRFNLKLAKVYFPVKPWLSGFGVFESMYTPVMRPLFLTRVSSV